MKRWMICVLALLFGVVGIWGQEATPEASVLPLTETYTNEDQSLKFRYPEGWVLRPSFMSDERTPFTGFLANRDEVFDSPERVTGEVFVSIAIAHADFFETGEINLEDASAFEVAQTLRSQYIALASENGLSEDELTISEITVISVIQKDAAHFLMDTPLSDDFILIVDEGFDLFSLYAVSSAEGEIELWEPTILSIAESVVYHPVLTEEATAEPLAAETPDPIAALLSATYTSEGGNVTISYPEEWLIREGIDSTIDDTWFEIASSRGSVDRDFPLPGDVLLTARIGRIDQIFRGITSSDANYVEILQALHDGLQERASEDDSNIYLSEVEEDTEGLYPKAVLIYIDDGEGQIIMLVDYGNENIGFFIMKVAPDDLTRYLPVEWVIVDSVQFHEPQSN